MKPHRRICLDARYYRRSTAGVGRYTRALIAELQTLDPGTDYTVILTPDDHAEWPKEGVPSNWHTEVMNVPIYSRAEQTTLLNFLNHSRFDLVHFTMFNHPVRYKKPFVVTIHDLTMSLFPNRPLWHPRTWAYRYVMRHAAQAARHVIVPSDATKHDVSTMLGIADNKITITYEAVEPAFVPHHDEARFAELRQKYGLTKPFLFFVNAWRPHKGLPDLLQAFSQVKATHDIQLLVAGKPNPKFPDIVSAVEAAKQASSDVLTPGFVSDEDMVDLYSMASIFVFPSHYEGFGLGALEAIACGCPIIAAKNSSLPEVLGDAAHYFPTGDTHALAKEIKTLLDNPSLLETLRTNGLEQAKKFSFTKMAQETLAVYEKALKK